MKSYIDQSTNEMVIIIENTQELLSIMNLADPNIRIELRGQLEIRIKLPRSRPPDIDRLIRGILP